MENKKVYAFVVGDLFHVNHVRFLKCAKDFGNLLIVGVLTDEAVMAYKRKPIFSLSERLEIVSSLKFVDQVVTQKERSPLNNLKRYAPSVVVHGDDWKDNFPDVDKIKELGVKIAFTPYLEGVNTTKIIKEINKYDF